MRFIFNGKEIEEKDKKYYRPLRWEDNFQTVILRKLTIEEEIESLENWFDNYFRMQLEQHSWQKDYKPSEDPYFKNEDGSARTYETFEDVILQAEFVRNEIKTLKSKL